jgi:hypothetical protein
MIDIFTDLLASDGELTVSCSSDNNCKPDHSIFTLLGTDSLFVPNVSCDSKLVYSGICVIRVFPTSCDIRQKFMVPKYFC